MFGKKKKSPTLDKEQLELFENAQRRIKQKKRLYFHLVFFLFGVLVLLIASEILGIGKEVNLLGLNWVVYAIVFWFFLFIYHFISVFITNKFMGKAWEKQQLDKLVAKQNERIEALKQQFLKEETKIAQSAAYNERIAAKHKPQLQSSIKTQNLTIIVATGEQNAIGKNNDLIWHLRDDLKRFKLLTNGHHIIMGRKTFESFPKPLPNRTHVVITRQKDYKAPLGVIVVHTLDDALDAAKSDEQPFIIGGGEIYKQAMGIADTIELTRVHAIFEDADTFFPEIDDSVWKEINRDNRDADEAHEYAFSFITYSKRAI